MPMEMTRSAEGFGRRAFSVSDVKRMMAAGILAEDENFELIEGEIVPMAAKNHTHERVKSTLNLALARMLPDELWLGVESSIQLGLKTFVEPDLCIYPRHFHLDDVRGPDLALAIEVADTTLAFDRGRKAQLYAAFGVPELWVVDANTRTTWIHRGPGMLGWGDVIEVPATSLLQPRVPGLYLVAIRLAELD